MKKTELMKVLEDFNFRPGKILGQNFLIDDNLLEFIVRTTAPQPNEVILEAGPGFGALTRKMLDSGTKVHAIEFDHRICDYLRNNLKNERLHLTEGDACRVNIAEILPPNKDFRSIANLPYAISSIYIARLLELPRLPLQMLFMLQKEMGLRLASQPGTKNYGALSVRAQAMYDVKLLRTVPRQVFFPQPGVDSALVDFQLKPDALSQDEGIMLGKVVRCAFSQRRKKMIKPLARNYGQEIIEAAFAELSLDLEIRPDKLDTATFIALSKAIYKLI
jgi:16S rRNA (adenine1518-N6/adenine1519-N6)-dimethyltransferase